MINSQPLLSFIDLTYLQTEETEKIIQGFFNQAISPIGQVAAVCIFPQLVSRAVNYFQGTSVKVATVANFPFGQDPLAQVLQTLHQVIAEGVNEIDVVFPYVAYLSGQHRLAINFIESCKKVCRDKVILKVILETGKLLTDEVIETVARDVIHAGADFLKTSTGKITPGATIPAARILLKIIQEEYATYPVGLKVSGGIKTIAQAEEYIQLVIKTMGEKWLTPNHFRIGTSTLLV